VDEALGLAACSELLVEELSWALSPQEALRRLHKLPYVLLLESASVGGRMGRYSYLAADPFAVLTDAKGLHLRGPIPLADCADVFAVMQRLVHEFRSAPVAGLPPFQGGIAGLLAYELCHAIERLPQPRYDEFDLPAAVLGCYDWVIAWDHQAQRCWLMSTGLPEREGQPRRARAEKRAKQVAQWLHDSLPTVSPHPAQKHPLPARALAPQFPVPGWEGVTSNFSRPDYISAVRKAIAYVHAGDCFQVNLSQRLMTSLRTHPLNCYLSLRERNPAPMAGYFDAGTLVILSASPERFLLLDPSGWVETRPIKGTRPRGVTAEEDGRYRDELANSAKDRAENVMIVDLLRNDLGRVCRYGTIEVTGLCEVETFRTVHHLVSTIRGQLRPECGPGDLLRASFPGGSVTGAPKVRAMEIIAELEPTVRGPYCGCLICLGFSGAMDSSILIRTATAARGWLQFPVGGGIVADSDPVAEYEETLHKAQGLLRALAP